MPDDEQSRPGEMDGGQPGASARREHERRRSARERRARERWDVVGLGGVGAGLAKLNSPQHERAWAVGARGEERVAERLHRYLRDSGVVVLHDRRIPGSQANIDHVAIGPGGVTVIDAKHYQGKVRAETRGGLLRPRTEHLVIRGRDQTKLIDGVRRQVELLVSICDATDVRGALCMANVDGLPTFGRVIVSGIAVDGPKRIAALARRPGSLATAEIQQLAATLATAFPPA